MFHLDADYKKIKGRQIDANLFEGSEKETKSIDRELGCDVYYWSPYEETSFIVTVSAHNETDFPGSDDWNMLCGCRLLGGNI